jgi:DNA topoisomerase-2
MHLFDSNNNIAKYKNPQEIISEFVQVRLEFYAERKKNLLANYNHSLDVLSNKIRFVRKICDEDIVIFKKKKDEINALLKSNKFVQFENSYDYLLNMKIYTFTYELIEEMKAKQTKLNEAIATLKSTTPTAMWKSELN